MGGSDGWPTSFGGQACRGAVWFIPQGQDPWAAFPQHQARPRSPHPTPASPPRDPWRAVGKGDVIWGSEEQGERAAVDSLRVTAASPSGQHGAELTCDSMKSLLGGSPDGRTENHLGALQEHRPPDSSSSDQNQTQEDVAEPSKAERWRWVQASRVQIPAPPLPGGHAMQPLSVPNYKTGPLTRPTAQGGM